MELKNMNKKQEKTCEVKCSGRCDYEETEPCEECDTMHCKNCYGYYEKYKSKSSTKSR